MEYHRKRKVDRVGPSAMMAINLTSPSASSQIMDCENSPIATHSSSPPPLPPVEELPAEDTSELALSH